MAAVGLCFNVYVCLSALASPKPYDSTSSEWQGTSQRQGESGDGVASVYHPVPLVGLRQQ